MPADKLLVTLLRNLQSHSEQQDTPRLLSTASSLLASLSNPLNLTLLTAQLLTAPAIWTRPDGLRTCLRCMGVFQASAMAILRFEQEKHERKQKKEPEPFGRPQLGGNLSREDWVKAIIHGADERSPRWTHVIVLAGLLIGFEAQERQGMPASLRQTVESALVKAINLAIEDVVSAEELSGQCIALVLNYSFDVLSDGERTRLGHHRLLPILFGSAFFSSEGYRAGYFLGPLEPDIVQLPGADMYSWPEKSPSYMQTADMLTRPLISTMGPLSRLIAFSIDHTGDWHLISNMMDDLVDFSRTLLDQWRHLKLSSIDVSEESLRYDKATLTKTLPSLWRLLRSVLFATSITLRGILGRTLGDRNLSSPPIAPHLASQALHILRNLYFISSRLNSASLSQHTFVYLTAIDLLSAFPPLAETFIHAVCPAAIGTIPAHALDRTLDLFFLNTAEHFVLVLSSPTNEDLLLAAAAPYLTDPSAVSAGDDVAALNKDNALLEIFEAAHAVTLAVFSVPQSADAASKHLPFYVNALFRVFPQNLSARQFRLAFRTLLGICTPPSPLAGVHPQMAETLLEVLHQRAWAEPARPAPFAPRDQKDPTLAPASPTADSVAGAEGILGGEERLVERTALTLTLIDCLPALPPQLLQEWLPLAAGLIPRLDSSTDRQKCRDRFWDVLSSGEMDVERSMICVGWWGTRGGREAVLFSGEDSGIEMSGALGGQAVGKSKL